MLNRWNDVIANHSRLAGAVLFLFSFVLYARALTGGFVYDDNLQVIGNLFVINAALWPRIFTGSVWSFQGNHTSFYRPAQIFLYWALYRLGGANSAAFHLLNVLLYAATVWLVFRLGEKLFKSHLASFAGALLWAFHPLHVEVVAWISALPEVGCGFFYLFGFLAFLRAEKAGARRVAWHTLSALAYFSALFFKEMAVSFPLLLLAYWFFVAERATAAKSPDRFVRWLPYCFATAAYLVIRTAALYHNGATTWHQKFSVEVIAAALGLLGQHTRLFFWPTHLNVFRMFDVASGLRSPWLWFTLLLLPLMFWLRKRVSILSFLVSWWAVTLVPVLDIRFLSFPLLAERFSYIPSMGLCLAISFLGFSWISRRPSNSRVPELALLASLAVAIVLLGVQTARAIPNWHDNETLVKYSVPQAPNSAVLRVQQGLILQYRAGDTEGAIREYEAALELNRTSLRPLPGVVYDCYLSLGEIAYARGHLDEAVSYFQKATGIRHDMSEAYVYLATIYFPHGEYAKAAEYLSQAVEVNPYDVQARFFLGTCWMKLGKYRGAAEQFHAAREVDPSYWQAFDAEARALEASGDMGTAARVRSLRPDPSSE